MTSDEDRQKRLLAALQVQFDFIARDVRRAIRVQRRAPVLSAIECMLAAITLGLAARDHPDYSHVKWAAMCLLAASIVRIIRDK